MDINDLRSLFTVLMLVCFIGIVAWAYSGRRKQAYDEAARMPLEEEDLPAPAAGRDAGHANT